MKFPRPDLYKNELEYLEAADVPLHVRISITEDLARINSKNGSNHYFLDELDRLIKKFPARNWDEEPLKILDVGTGIGGLLETIDQWAKKKKIKTELRGLEIDAEFSEIANKKLAEKNIAALITVGNACDMRNIKDDSFDMVVSNFVVHHIRSKKDVTAFFKEIYRVTRFAYAVRDFQRTIRGILYVMTGVLVGQSKILYQDGIKSVRRAYRSEEINAILQSLRDTDPEINMKCKAAFILPFWEVKGLKSLPKMLPFGTAFSNEVPPSTSL